MADVPDTLVLRRHRDLEGMGRFEIWARRSVLAAIALFSVLGVANVFGQRPATVQAEHATAQLKDGVLEVTIPKREATTAKDVPIQT